MNKAVTLHILAVFLLLLSIQVGQCRKSSLSIPASQEQVLIISMDYASIALKTTYLGNFQGEILTQYPGIFYGRSRQPIVSMPVRLAHYSCHIQINLIFKVDTGTTPFSSLTAEALAHLFSNCPTAEQTFTDNYAVVIAGHTIRVQKSKAHYKNLNILGTDFLEEKNSRLEFDYFSDEDGQFKLILQGSKLAKNKIKEDL